MEITLPFSFLFSCSMAVNALKEKNSFPRSKFFPLTPLWKSFAVKTSKRSQKNLFTL